MLNDMLLQQAERSGAQLPCLELLKNKYSK